MNIKRILVFALALMVMAMPIGFAEGGYGALTLSNFHVEAPGMDEPLDIDAALKIGVGAQEDGTGRLDVELTGGGQTAFTASAGFDKDKVQAIVGGSSYLFEVPMAELQKKMTESASVAGAMTGATGNLKPEDIQKIKDLCGGYAAIIKKYSDPEFATKFSAEIMTALNVQDKGKEQEELELPSSTKIAQQDARTAEDEGQDKTGGGDGWDGR
jgi:hypothetical protein